MAEAPPFTVFGPRTALLGTEALRNHLGTLLARPPAKLLVASAYVTRVGVNWLHRQTRDAAVDCDIVARWSPRDLLSGASDVEGCRLAMDRGWRFHVLPDLHAKVTLVDETDIVVGSANLTGAGMSLVPASNREFGVAAKATEQDVLACRGLLADATLMTRSVLEEIARWVEANGRDPATDVDDFPAGLRDCLSGVPRRLFTAELPWLACGELLAHLVAAAPEVDVAGARHDVGLLGLAERYSTSAAARAAVSVALARSRSWRWLRHVVEERSNREIWHGSLTAALHDALCDDPRPYRRDVKTLVSNLFSYAEAFGNGLRADRPNWSQRLSVDVGPG